MACFRLSVLEGFVYFVNFSNLLLLQWKHLIFRFNNKACLLFFPPKRSLSLCNRYWFILRFSSFLIFFNKNSSTDWHPQIDASFLINNFHANINIILLLGAHTLQIAILTNKEGIGWGYKLCLLEIGKINHINIIIINLQQVVYIPLVKYRLNFILNPPLIFPSIDQKNYLKVQETNIVDILKQWFDITACKLINFRQKMLTHFNKCFDLMVLWFLLLDIVSLGY